MGVKRLIAEKKYDPCDLCRHEYLRQIEQFTYEHGCDKNMPSRVFYSGFGCYHFKKKKGDLPL